MLGVGKVLPVSRDLGTFPSGYAGFQLIQNFTRCFYCCSCPRDMVGGLSVPWRRTLVGPAAALVDSLKVSERTVHPGQLGTKSILLPCDDKQ